MEITQKLVKERFESFNRQIFGNKLPMPRICLSNARTFLGACTFKTKRGLLGKKTRYDFAIRISTQFDMSETEFEDTLIHEMIHYYIGVNQIEDTSAHGQKFRSMMADINSRFGRHITISHRSDGDKAEAPDNTGAPGNRTTATVHRRQYHVIAVASLADGRTGFKVLPRVAPSILKFYNGVLSSGVVKTVNLFMSDSPFFYSYPNSSSLRVHIIDRETVMQHLEGAMSIFCDGKTLRVER